jgi:hypothetical protein
MPKYAVVVQSTECETYHIEAASLEEALEKSKEDLDEDPRSWRHATTKERSVVAVCEV